MQPHEQVLLAGVKTMLQHRDILQGTHFTWVTDHRSLEYVLTQRNLSGRQACWMDKLSSFDFKVQYVPGEDNVLPDALSCLYEFNAPGTIPAPSEFVEHDLPRPDVPDASDTSPLLFCLHLSWLAVRPRLPHFAGVLVLRTN